MAKRSRTAWLWDNLTPTEELLLDAAQRRQDKDAFGKHWMAALTRLATAPDMDAQVREHARACFKADALARLDAA